MHFSHLAIFLSLYSASYAFPAVVASNTTMAVPTKPVKSTVVSKKPVDSTSSTTKPVKSTSLKQWMEKHKKALLLGTTATAATIAGHYYGAFNPVYEALPKNLRDRKFVDI